MSRRFSDEQLAEMVASPNTAHVGPLGEELQRVYAACFDTRMERARALLNHLLSEGDSYHNYKESMAHAGLLVILALAGGILSLKDWPPHWVAPFQVYLSPKWIAFSAFGLLWVLGHIYIRWQLRNRRGAAITYGGALRALAESVPRDLGANDLRPYSKSDTQQGRLAAFLSTLADFIFPFPRATLHEDVGKEHYPSWLGKAIRDQERAGTGAIWGELLVTVGSFLALVLVLVQTLARME